MDVKALAKITGTVESAKTALGPLAKIYSRPAQKLLAKHTEERGWKGTASLDEKAKADLEFLKEHLDTFNGFPIQPTALEIPLLSILGPPDKLFSKFNVRHHVVQGEKMVMASDASAFGVYAYSIESPIHIEISAVFTEAKMTTSSSFRGIISPKEIYPPSQDDKV